MKKYLFVLLALMVSCVTMSMAKIYVSKSEAALIKHDNLIRLCYKSTSDNTVEVSIKDNDGHEIFNEEIRGQRFIRPYNFINLERGDYMLSVKDNTGIVYSEKIRFYDRAHLSHVSKMQDQNDKFLVAIPRKGNNKVNVCVFNSEDNLVYSEVVDGNVDYAKVFNLKNVKDGSIKVFDLD